MVSIKQMKYTDESSNLNILANSYYKGFHYIIIDRHGSHPCAYVEIPENHPVFGKTDRDVWWVGAQEVTYGRNYLEDIIKNSWIIGWDYAHCFDRTRFSPGTEYSSFEILEDVFEAIEDLIHNY